MACRRNCLEGMRGNSGNSEYQSCQQQTPQYSLGQGNSYLSDEEEEKRRKGLYGGLA